MSVNYSDNSSLDLTALAKVYQGQFRASSNAFNFVTPENRKNTGGEGRSARFVVESGMDVGTDTLTPGSDLTVSDPTLTAVNISSVLNYKHMSLGGETESTTPAGLLDGMRNSVIGWAGEKLDSLLTTALSSATNLVTVDGGAESALTQADVITAAKVGQMTAELDAYGAPRFQTPFGPMFLGLVHPYVAHDLKFESSGQIASGIVNAAGIDPAWYTGLLGAKYGVLWYMSPTGLIDADGGANSGPTMRTYIVSRNALGYAYADLPPAPDGIEEIRMAEGISVRTSHPASNAGLYKYVTGFMMNGFSIVNNEGVQGLITGWSQGSYS